MKIFIILLIVAIFPIQIFSQVYDPEVSSLIESTNLDSLKHYVAELSGRIPVILNDTDYTIASRFDTAIGNHIASIYIAKKLESFGFTPLYDDFIPRGRNVYAFQEGAKYPGRIYMICAHYDASPPGPVAPGADDNASGTAAVLEAARNFSKRKTDYSIIYALWDREEQGLIGSGVYAGAAKTRGDSIMGVINLDMISYDSNNDMSMDIHTRPVANSVELAASAGSVNSTYALGLNPVIKNPGSGSSDHASFWNNDYGAIMMIESFQDFNQYYHTTGDLLSAFNDTIFLRISKLAIGTVASLAGVSNLNGIEGQFASEISFELHQNFPNPFNPATKISYRLASGDFVTLEIFNLLGEKIGSLVESWQEAGSHSFIWNGSNYASGIYIYRLSAGGQVRTRMMAMMK